MTALRQAVDAYLHIRRALGFRLRGHQVLLRQFVDDLEAKGQVHITTAHAVAWATAPQDCQPYNWKARLTVVRGLARYMKTLDPLTEVPPADILGYRATRQAPYLYSQSDVSRLLTAAGGLVPAWRAMTHQTLFGLLAATGMRVGETIRLNREDVDSDRGRLTVRDTKFKKSRRMPLHPSTAVALAEYAAQCHRRFPRTTTESFFVSVRGARLLDTHVHATFREAARQAGLEHRPGAGRPRLHGLRHTFAVNTLLRWHQSEADVGAMLPLLSAYLGHVSPASTYWYLEAAPELLAVVSQRLERAMEALR